MAPPLLLTLILTLTLLLLHPCHSLLTHSHTHPHDGGFCSLTHTLTHTPADRFPLTPPLAHIPWVWDATVTKAGTMVEATAVSRNACRFDVKLWKKIVDAYPQYAHQLGGGITANIYAPVVPGYDYVRANPKGYKGERKRGLQSRTVVCVYLLRSEVVARASSLRILDVEIAELSTIQIRCPIPDHLLLTHSLSTVKWDSMRIERRLSPHPEHKESELPNSTETFRVCNMHRLQPASLPLTKSLAPPLSVKCTAANHTLCSKDKYTHLRHEPEQKQDMSQSHTSSHPHSVSSTKQYLHKLSLCTATARSSRSHLVEWIEYHKMLGVEHFYMYDTNPRSTSRSLTLSAVLADYIHTGIVTVVRWPYENCVKSMGSGRKVMISKPFKDVFTPPRAISQTGALASCYSRHKEFSEWMIHIDDDEFLAFNPTAKFGGVKVQNLYELVSQITKKDPLTNAVSFYPLCVTDCGSFDKENSGHGGDDRTNSSPLPRYGRWTKGKFCPFFETKLIMRTAAIGMFFTHYITLREQPPLGSSFSHYNREPTQLPRKDAAVLHYKDIHNLEASGSIFGATLPIDGQKLKSMECNLVPDMKENTTAARVLDSLTKLALPYLERNYVSQLTEIYAFNV